MLLQIEQVAKRIGDRTLFEGVSLNVAKGNRIGIVGPNGAGKSTLLKVIAGDETADEGRVACGRSTRIGMLRQEIDPAVSHSVTEEAASALAHLDALERELRRLEHAMADAGHGGKDVDPALAERYHRATTAFEHQGGFEREARVAAVLAGLGFDDVARQRPVSSFSGGWMMRIELAKLLLSAPDVLLLDEPTNHLDLPAIQWFEETLDAFDGAVLTVSHDRAFLQRHVDRVGELDGTGRFTIYEGGYDRYLEQRRERRAILQAAKEKQDREIAQTERFIERFRAKATKARQVQSRVKRLEKLERIELEPEGTRRLRMRIPEPPRSGETVLALEDAKAYGEQRVYDGVSFLLRRGDRVALAGPNGAGKSTLLRMAAGVLDADSGTRTVGHNVGIAFYAQHQLESLDASRSVLDELGTAAAIGDVPRLRGHLGAFLFSGDDVEKRVSVLSGGEKARLALAKMLLHPANLLVLDEPTNHLDIGACEVLEEALSQYKGTLLFVSHDRSFINALATRVVEVRGGVLREFAGNYDDYLRKLAEEEAAANARASRQAATVAPGPRPPGASAAAAPGAGPSAAAKPQLTREQRKARERLVRKIARLEDDIAARERTAEELGWQLGDPELYKDVDRMRTVSDEREAVQASVAEAYAEWERLADELAALDDGAAS